MSAPLPMFSLVVPCYKVEQWIRPCLDSVLAQDDASWEMLCVDDGSPDATGAILDEYAAKDPRVKVIHQKNGGLSAARNAALAVAQGEWLVYLDGDDVLPPGVFSRVRAALAKAPDVDVVWGDMIKFEDGEAPKWPEEKDTRAYVADVSQTVCARHFSGYFQCFYFRRSVYGDIPFVGLSWCEERPYVAKCMSRARRVLEVGFPVYGFRARVGSITHSKMTLEQCNGSLDATHVVIATLSSSGKMIEPALMRMLLTQSTEGAANAIVMALDSRDRFTAWRYWFASLKPISSYRPMTAWRRFMIWACRTFPCRFVALILAVLPIRLKILGIHR